MEPGHFARQWSSSIKLDSSSSLLLAVSGILCRFPPYRHAIPAFPSSSSVALTSCRQKVLFSAQRTTYARFGLTFFCQSYYFSFQSNQQQHFPLFCLSLSLSNIDDINTTVKTTNNCRASLGAQAATNSSRTKRATLSSSLSSVTVQLIPPLPPPPPPLLQVCLSEQQQSKVVVVKTEERATTKGKGKQDNQHQPISTSSPKPSATKKCSHSYHSHNLHSELRTMDADTTTGSINLAHKLHSRKSTTSSSSETKLGLSTAVASSKQTTVEPVSVRSIKAESPSSTTTERSSLSPGLHQQLVGNNNNNSKSPSLVSTTTGLLRGGSMATSYQDSVSPVDDYRLTFDGSRGSPRSTGSSSSTNTTHTNNGDSSGGGSNGGRKRFFTNSRERWR